MKTLLLVSCIVAAAASAARASELHYLPGGQPTCQYEEQEGCSIAHKVVYQQPSTPESWCFTHALETVRTKTSVDRTEFVITVAANLCKNPTKAVVNCFDAAIAGARQAGTPIKNGVALRAVADMCATAK